LCKWNSSSSSKKELSDTSREQLTMDWGSVKLKTSHSMVILTMIWRVVLMTWGALHVIVLALVLLFFHRSLRSKKS
jgi:hypothetical protein